MIAEGSSSLFGAEVPWIEHDYQFFETFAAFCSNPLRVLLCSIACDAKGAASSSPPELQIYLFVAAFDIPCR
jgi:DNA-binding FadR family transcriptional regulator